MVHKKIKVKIGTRVTDSPQAGQWGTVIAIEDRRKDKQASVRIAAKASNYPLIFTVLWDNGKTERLNGKRFWFDGDDPGFGRPILRDPKAKNPRTRRKPIKQEFSYDGNLSHLSTKALKAMLKKYRKRDPDNFGDYKYAFAKKELDSRKKRK